MHNTEGNRVSFILALLLVWFFMYYSYSKFFFGADNRLNYYIILLHLIGITLYLIYATIIKNYFRVGKVLILVIVFVAFTVISYLNNKSGMEKLLGLIVILLSIYCFQKKPMESGQTKIVWGLSLLSVLLFLLNTNDFEHMADGVVKFNPNAGGFLLSLLFMSSVVFYLKYRFIRYLIVAVISVLLQFIYLSRTAFLSILVFLLLHMWFNLKRGPQQMKHCMFWIIVAVIGGLFFAWFYSTVLYEVIGWGKVKIYGKDFFTGRELIWQYTFQSLKDTWLFGVGSHLNQKFINAGAVEIVSNAHNQPLAMIGAFGLVPFIVFYFALAYIINSLYLVDGQPVISPSPYIYIITILLMSWFDVYFFSEYNWVPILFIYSLIVTNSHKGKKTDH